jgi:hypothetical protein
MNRFLRPSAQILTPLRENPPCLELPSRSEAYCHVSRPGARDSVIESATWPVCTSCPERSRGERLRGECPECMSSHRPSRSFGPGQRDSGRYLRQRSVPLAI